MVRMMMRMMLRMMEKNLDDDIQMINILETLSTTHRKTTSISSGRSLEQKEAKTGASRRAGSDIASSFLSPGLDPLVEAALPPWAPERPSCFGSFLSLTLN